MISIDYKYTYLLMGMIFLVFWLVLFLSRMDNRREMLHMSLVFSIAGPLSDVAYTKDWWRPETIQGTTIGFEALFVGFVLGGVSAVIYEDVFRRHLRPRRRNSKNTSGHRIAMFRMLLVSASIFFSTFFIFELNSLQATLLATSIPTLYMWRKRKDLIADSVYTGLLLVAVAAMCYGVLDVLTPGWIDRFWVFANTPRIMVWSLPIDDVLWYFFAGMFIGPLYEYSMELKFAGTAISRKQKK